MIKVYYICMIGDYLLYTREKNEQNENYSAEKFPKTFTWRTLILTV